MRAAIILPVVGLLSGLVAAAPQKSSSSSSSASASKTSSAASTSSTASSGSGDSSAAPNLTVTNVVFTFLPSNITYDFESYLNGSSNATDYDDDQYDSFYNSYINFTVSDPRSGAPSANCSGTFNNAINDTTCGSGHYQFQLNAYFPDYWQLNVSHTVSPSGQSSAAIRSSTVWVVAIVHGAGFEDEFDLYGNTTTTYKYNQTLTSAYTTNAAPGGWTGDAAV